MPAPSPGLSATTRRAGLLAAGAALLSGCSGPRILDRLVPDGDYRAETGIAYGDDPRQVLDVYRPAQDSAPGAARPPLVVFFYGGTWTHGTRADYRFVGEALASRGAVVVIPDYRLSPQVRSPAFLQDSAAAVRWAADRAAALGADPDRIVPMGHSAGAYNAAMLALDPRWLEAAGVARRRIAAWIGMAGPYDFLPIDDPEAQVAFGWPDTPRDSQPIVHAGPGAPRTLLLAADHDRVVDPDRNSAALAARLRAAGVDVTMHRYPRVGHVALVGSLARPLRWLAPAHADVVAFLGLPPPR